MTDTQALLDEALVPIVDEVARLRPGGADIIDVHTHLGLDEDGMTLDPDGLVAMLDQVDAQQAVVFPLHDPERVARLPAAQRPGAGVGGGQRGPPHPVLPARPGRASRWPRRSAAWSWARGGSSCIRGRRRSAWPARWSRSSQLAEQARVPILIHAGRGLPDTFAAELVEVAHKHPGAGLIMAHVGVADQAVMGDGLRDHPRAVFDSSWMSTLDMLALFTRVPAERIAFGSDPPYGRTLTGLFLLLRTLRLPRHQPGRPAAHAGRRGPAADRRRGAAAGHRAARAAAAGGRRPADAPAHGADAGVRAR